MATLKIDTKIRNAERLLQFSWDEGQDDLGFYYRDQLRPDLHLTVRGSSETNNWHVQAYCPATKGFLDYQFSTPDRAFAFANSLRWSVAQLATGV